MIESDPRSKSMITAAAKPRALLTVPQLRVGFIKADIRNLWIIAAGFIGVLLLIPPARIYPITDDWIFSQSVNDLIHLVYKPHDWTQPIAIGHLAWGALFAALFGHTFTVLTAANLVMSIFCLLVFYLLLRHLKVQPGPALFAVALLGLNPIYLYISYSFMTDVTFLFYILAACLLFMRGLEGHGERWLWVGGLAAGLAYLTRQYGILIIVVALVYLWLSRQWPWRQAIAICTLPAIAVVGYAIWQHFQPSPLIDVQTDLNHAAIWDNLIGYLGNRMLRIEWLLPGLGLSLAPLVRLPRRAIWAMPVFALIVYYQFRSLNLTGSVFPENGNVVDSTGLLMFAYDPNQVWNQSVWALLGIVGGLVFSLCLVYWIEQIAGYVRSKPWRNPRAQDTAFLPLGLAALIAVAVLVATPSIFDRYWLGVLPMLMIPGLRKLGTQIRTYNANSEPAVIAGNATSRSWSWRWALLAPLAIFSLLALRDYKEHATVRWTAAESLANQGISVRQISAGNEWDSWNNFTSGAQYIRQTGDLSNINYPPNAVMDRVYVVDDILLSGYEQIGVLTYHSWLDGGATRQVLIQKRK